ncbi:murein transglycosylase A [Erythrobacter sp. HKB08]|uniref:murein transglycosylase A n=1 Tax=Erythrobacter sp. HKB08 TaxID=2502843 RepID=UPI0010086FF2|nr:MltA domain-containing protein [Erythrobacter sp. HKB08]
MLRAAQRLTILGAASVLAACTVIPKSTAPVTPPVAASSALLLGVASAGSINALGMEREDAQTGLASFRESCRYAESREDRSGLTTPEDWQAVCGAARSFSGDPRNFFAAYFEPVRVGTGEAFATGYFEPEIRGSRTRRPGFDAPVYGMPSDLERCWREDIAESERTGRAPLSRRLPDGRCVEYFTRAEIEDGALEGRGLEIAWAADPVELFFLQIQGSGRLVTPEGEVIRIGYAGQNGHAYTGIGGVMRERGLLGDGPGQYAGSMQGIMQYIRENPAEGRDLMRLNESWVFFRELTGDGPLGSLGVPVRGESSVAVDPNFVPYGAPVWLRLDRPEANGLWIAQDTGGAIKGANRFDTFWGAGERAREVAGGMSGRGQAVILLPKSAASRLKTR